MANVSDASGAAALSVCESLLLCLGDRAILSEAEILGIIEDAVAAHENAAIEGDNAKSHTEAAAILRGILAGGNSVRRR